MEALISRLTFSMTQRHYFVWKIFDSFYWMSCLQVYFVHINMLCDKNLFYIKKKTSYGCLSYIIMEESVWLRTKISFLFRIFFFFGGWNLIRKLYAIKCWGFKEDISIRLILKKRNIFFLHQYFFVFVIMIDWSFKSAAWSGYSTLTNNTLTPVFLYIYFLVVGFFNSRQNRENIVIIYAMEITISYV